MKHQRARLNGVIPTAAGIAIAALAGCSSGSVTGASSAASLRSTSTSGSAVGATGTTVSAPVATESNPPGDIPDNTAFVPYTDPAGFVVKVPEGWARSLTGSNVTFTDKLNSVMIEPGKSVTAPTAATATSTQVQTLKSSVPKFQLVQITSVARAAGNGILVKYLADSAPNPVTNKVVRNAVELYLFWHNGTLVSLSLTGPLGADNVDPWRKVTESLSWTR